MIKVYFETPNHKYAELIAVFTDAEIYDTCFPALEKLANKTNMILTESVYSDMNIERLEKKITII